MASVNRISDTIQEFNGERYYLCGQYFQYKGKRLHRTVWEYHNGEIPKGYHVHHIDGNRSNNDIDNLTLLKGTDHARKHSNEESRKESERKAIRLAIQVAPEWHRSEEGKKWHSERGKLNAEMRQINTFTCDFCGKEFQTKDLSHTKRHFCSNNCKSAYRRASGVDNETRTCIVCGKEFTTNKYSKAKTCSQECRIKARWGD